jgi:hypothetical protein
MTSDHEVHVLRAFSFLTPYKLDQILARLTADGSRRWGRGESDSLGTYVRSGTEAGSPLDDTFYEISLKFFFEDDRCILDIRFHSPRPDAKEDWERLSAYIHERLLPLVEALDIREVDNYAS